MATRAAAEAEVRRLRRIAGVVAKLRITDFTAQTYDLLVKDSRGRTEQQLRTSTPGGAPGKWVRMTPVESAAIVSDV